MMLPAAWCSYWQEAVVGPANDASMVAIELSFVFLLVCMLIVGWSYAIARRS